MNRNQIAEIIKTKTDINYARNWRDDSEQLLNFDYGFNSDHLGLTLSDDEDKFDYALNLFERRCEYLLAHCG